MPADFPKLLTDSVLRTKAGSRSYQRGHDYYMHGHVEFVKPFRDGIQASVRGQLDYFVTLTAVKGRLDHDCDCPVGRDGDFCKHCVAVGLAWLNGGTREGKKDQISMVEVAKRLAGESAPALAKMLIDWAADDTLLSQRLLQYAARRAGPKSAIAAARAAFKKAAIPRRYFEYGEASEYAEAVDNAIDAFEEILADGHAAEVMDLCEEGLRALSTGSEMVEDEDGDLSDLSDRLSELHLDAAEQAKPDPVAFASRLFDLEIDHNIDAFFRTPQTYAEVLGPGGLAAFKLLAASPVYNDHPRINGIRESVARASGDIGGLVAMMSQDLSSAYRYINIVSVCKEAGRFDDLLLWAEKGLKAFPKDFSLREAAANEYHRRNDHEMAMKLVWTSYTDSPGLDQYKNLQQHAKQANDWPEWRDNAIGLVRQRIAAAKGKSDHSTLVEIFFNDGDKEEAWREAQKGGCASHHWLNLAEAREKDHPGDAAPIYLRQVEEEVSRTTNGDYNNPVALLIRTAGVMKRIGASAEFARQLDTLRVKYKIKRNFIKLLDKRSKQLTQP